MWLRSGYQKKTNLPTNSKTIIDKKLTTLKENKTHSDEKYQAEDQILGI